MRTPRKPTPGINPVLTYASPDIRDLVFYILVDSTLKTYNQPAYGTAYPGPGSKYPNHKLVYVSAADEDQWVKWYYAADRANQGAYNFEYSEAGLNGGYDSYTRTYFEPRENVGDYFDECDYVESVDGVGGFQGLVVSPDFFEHNSSITLGSDVITFKSQSSEPTTPTGNNILYYPEGLSFDEQLEALEAHVEGGANVHGCSFINRALSYDFNVSITNLTFYGYAVFTLVQTGTFANSLSVSTTLTTADWGGYTTFVGGVDEVVGSGHPGGDRYIATGDPDPDVSYNPEFCNFGFTGVKVNRIPDKELDSCYVLITRTFEQLCPLTGTKINPSTGELEAYTTTVVPAGDAAAVAVNDDGVGTEVEPINCHWSREVTRVMRPFSSRTYVTNKVYSWPAVLDYIDLMDWELLGGSSRYYPRVVFKRNAYRGPTQMTVSETWYRTAALANAQAQAVYTMIPTSVTYACPFFTLNTGPCLHECVEIQANTGNSDPTWASNSGSLRSVPATFYTDWPDTLVISSKVMPAAHGYILQTITAEKPDLGDSAYTSYIDNFVPTATCAANTP